MTDTDQNTLLKLLNKWFESHDLNYINLFNQNKVAARIKEVLKAHGFWVIKRRGRLNKENLKQFAELQDQVNQLKQKLDKLNKQIIRCPCGSIIERRNGKFVCPDLFCNL